MESHGKFNSQLRSLTISFGCNPPCLVVWRQSQLTFRLYRKEKIHFTLIAIYTDYDTYPSCVIIGYIKWLVASVAQRLLRKVPREAVGRRMDYFAGIGKLVQICLEIYHNKCRLSWRYGDKLGLLNCDHLRLLNDYWVVMMMLCFYGTLVSCSQSASSMLTEIFLLSKSWGNNLHGWVNSSLVET